MHSKWFGRVGLTALVAGVLAGSSGVMGCAAERDPINRVQTNAIPKSFFIGNNFQDSSDDPEFIARTMVIDVPYGESSSDFLMFTNTENMVAKIKWEIEENYLVGRISFERVNNTDGKGLTPKAPADRDPSVPLAQNDGVPVYQFKIEKQFDIRRDYNSSTGEENNVITENDTDRRWQDREYVRVDFSENLNTTSYDFDTLAFLGVYNGIEYSSKPFDIQNPNDKNAPVIDVENGYFDVTNQVFAAPKMIDLGGFVIPGCMLPNFVMGGTAPDGNCNTNEITLRHSFRRVVNTDYEPVDWDGFRFETYGAFHNDRHGYAEDYGNADANWKRYINRYNVWERSHYYKDADKMEGATSCTTDDQCSGIGAVPGMSHCDTFNQKCTLPYHDRVAKPIAWHYAEGSPDLYFDSTREAAEDWDTAMRIAVQTAKYAECQRFTPDEDCATQFPVTMGNFADEEDATYLVKAVNACRRDAYAKGSDPKPCDDLADQMGDARGYSAESRAIAKMPSMVVLCHSPVTKEDLGFKDSKGNSICGKEGEVARLGDLRYHLVTNLSAVQTNSPWGIMTDASDPVTGEHVSASINVWTYVNDLYARGLVDVMRYIGGELKTEDITDGKYVADWVEAARTAGGAGLTPRMDQAEIDKRVAGAANTTVENLHAVESKFAKGGKFQTSLGYGKEQQLRAALINNLKAVAQTKASIDAPSVMAPIYQARINAIRGTDVEAAVVTPAMQQMARSAMGDLGAQQAVANSADPSSAAYKAASILQGLNPTLRRNLEQRLEMSLASRGSCMMRYEATAPLGYVALGDLLQQKFGKFNPNDAIDVQSARAEKMKDYLRRRAQYAVIVHEMGHSIGLRHNFVSSSDPWNYRWQYWALRTNAKQANTQCDEQTAGDGSGCVGPRWIDKVTGNESKNLIPMWMQSSTMDYAGEPTQDQLGLGAYDFGAARMFYGDVVTVYSDPKFNTKQAAGAVAQAHQNDFGGLLGFRYGTDFANPIHYSQLDNQIGMITKCDTVADPTAFKPATWNDDKDGTWNPVLDGHLVSNEQGKWTRCQQPKVDYVQWNDMKSTTDKTHAYDKKGRVRVPHAFASDEWADLGNVSVFRHDNGADLYELMHFWIAQQEMNHIFTNYRRGRSDFSIWGAFNRTLSRYHEKMRDSAKAIGLYTNIARDTVTVYNDGHDPSGFVADILKQVALTNTVASSIAFDHFAHVYARPQPGDHGRLGDEDGGPIQILRSFDSTGFAQGSSGPGGAAVKVANGVMGGFGTISLGGRPIQNALADNEGRDYNMDYTLNVGSYYEKAFAAMLFTESADNFISAARDDFVDPRFRAVSIADVFPDGFRRWLANNLTGDIATKGVYVRPTSQAGGVNPPPDGGDYVVLGQTSWWPSSGPEACFPVDDRIYCRDPFDGSAPAAAPTQVIDPEVGWEQQKFAALMSAVYIPENQKTNWVDMMRIYDVSVDTDPGFDNRVEFHDPFGHVLVAQSFGTETVFGKTVQKGIAARVLEYANEMLQKAVVTEPVTRNGVTVGYQPKLDATGNVVLQPVDGAVPATCDHSRACAQMKDYVSVPRYLMQVAYRFGWVRTGDLRGVY